MKKIKLTQGKFALVDNEDCERINQFNWYVDNTYGYWRAKRNIPFNGKQTTLLMARYILDVTDSKQFVDHRNHNTLDNQKHNLRICTHAENLRNRKIQKDNKSGYKGVSYFKRDRNWRARIHINHKEMYLGTFDNPKLAHKAYCKAATKYFGEFAHF